ncbi:MAG: thioredoxin domain-containing protein [Candidatus Andersenbacteria bacterium]
MNVKVIIGIVVGTALLIGGLVFWGNKTIPTKLGTKTDGAAQLVREYSPAIGATTEVAKVTLVEFGDFECPACAGAAPILRELVKQTKDLRLVFRHFPLDQHLNAETVAKAAEAANAQGKFWELYDLAYARQSEWNSLSIKDAEAKFESYAAELGLDLERFKQDRTKAALLDHIRLDKGEGLALGVTATPTLYLNGTKYEGDRDLESLKKAVAAARTSPAPAD